jgi:hypothetical protein
MFGQPRFFNLGERLRELSAKGDDLERIAALVDFTSPAPAGSSFRSASAARTEGR